MACLLSYLQEKLFGGLVGSFWESEAVGKLAVCLEQLLQPRTGRLWSRMS